LVAVSGTCDGPTIGIGLDAVTTSLQKTANVVYDGFFMRSLRKREHACYFCFCRVVVIEGFWGPWIGLVGW